MSMFRLYNNMNVQVGLLAVGSMSIRNSRVLPEIFVDDHCICIFYIFSWKYLATAYVKKDICGEKQLFDIPLCLRF